MKAQSTLAIVKQGETVGDKKGNRLYSEGSVYTHRNKGRVYPYSSKRQNAGSRRPSTEQSVLAVSPGQIWQERDKRVTRFIKIISVENDQVRVRTCTEAGELAAGSRETRAGVRRFGKAGGYRFVR